VIAKYKVAAPPEDDWRAKLDSVISAVLLNATSASFPLQTYAVFPDTSKTEHNDAYESGSKLVANRRILGLQDFSASTVIVVSSEAEGQKVQEALNSLIGNPAAIPDDPEPSNPDLISIDSVSRLCRGLIHTHASSSCSEPVPEMPEPSRFVIWLIISAFGVGLLGLAARRRRRNGQDMKVQGFLRHIQAESVDIA
jgi:hypothetical protein